MYSSIAAAELKERKKNVLSYSLGICLLALVYLVTAKTGLHLNAIGGVATAVWPPTGIVLASLLIFGRRLWPGITLGAFLVNLWATGAVVPAACIATGNTLEALVAFYGLQYLGFRKSLFHVKDVVLLIGVAAFGSTLVSATIGTLTSLYFGFISQKDFSEAFSTWWLGDALGDLLVASLLLVWSQAYRKAFYNRTKPLELVLFSLALIPVTAFLFFETGAETRQYLGPYFVFPFVIWASIRFGQRGATSTAFVISVISTWGTAVGGGPFSSQSLSENLLSLQAFTGVLSVTFLLFGAAIEERLASEKMLRDSESKFRRLAEADIIGTFFWRSDGKITELNNAFLKLVGYTREEFTAHGLYWRQLMPMGGLNERTLRELRETGVASPTEEHLQRKDGQLIPVLLGGAYLDDQQIQGVSFALDLSAEKRILSDLQRAVGEREELLAVVSHDLRNPLSSILLNAKLLLRAEGNDETGKFIRQQSDRLVRSAERMQKLIANILDVSRIESGSLQLQRRMEDPRAMMDEALENLRSLAEEKNIHMITRGSSKLGKIYCDHDRIMQVLMNLIGNSLKFTPKGGNIQLFVEEYEGMAQFAVQDSGPGIPPDQLPYVFNRYWQGDKDSSHGLGLGLAIAKGIVEAHGGRIWAEAVQPTGALLKFTLPLTKEERFHQQL